MGILRVYLAVCVIAAHSESVLPWATHEGREAVQVFFIISGFYMQLILSGDKYKSVWNFYRSRSLRIFFPYLISLGFVVGVSGLSGLCFSRWLTLSETVGQFSSAEETGGAVIFASLTNMTLFLQDAVMFTEPAPNGSIQFTSSFMESRIPLWRYLWVPQAWSVALELTFYLTAPLLVRKLSMTAICGVALISLLARMVCYRQFEILHDPWTYRFLPFELTHFCYGIMGCRIMLARPYIFNFLTKLGGRIESKLGSWNYATLVFAVLACLWLHKTVLQLAKEEAHDLVRGGGELVYLGSLTIWILIIPILFSLTRTNRIDREIGELSYPVYLLHYTIAMIVMAGSSITIGFGLDIRGEIVAILTISLALIMQVYLLNRFDGWRQRITVSASIAR